MECDAATIENLGRIATALDLIANASTWAVIMLAILCLLGAAK